MEARAVSGCWKPSPAVDSYWACATVRCLPRIRPFSASVASIGRQPGKNYHLIGPAVYMQPTESLVSTRLFALVDGCAHNTPLCGGNKIPMSGKKIGEPCSENW